MVAAYSGILSNDTIQPTPVKCTTGNCTWPLTPSLAVCGACKNSTFALQNHCEDGFCNFTLPSGFNANLFLGTFILGTDAFASVTSEHGVLFNDSASDRLYLAHIELFGVPSNDNVSAWESIDVLKDPPRFSYLSNTECALWFCIDVYNTSMTSSGQIQTVFSSFDRLNALPGSDTSDQFSNYSAVGSAPHYTIKTYLTEVMSGNLSLIAWDGTLQAWGDALPRGIWQGSRDPDQWIANLAMSLSNFVRSSNMTEPRPEYQGTAYELVFVIRWWWILYPAALVLSSILFLALVMVRTVHSPLSSWKGSPLTVLLFDVDEQTKKDGYTRIHERQGILEQIGETRVKFVQDGNGYYKFKAC
ncbi:hypothetical protein K461DRAFT_262990 [Myriangium duriaei CBS 260.36]|uniref:Uncharacterized protein n=1 Tax=Myriangium duriaei CBS 260.36 TaxID=1168546 RepID=A0A9P4IQ87_9PEZI|nr:hypothetical protein K461DRAFT_262990 [Myriangium duriaei CBS 260.36]